MKNATMNYRSTRRFVLTDSGKRSHPDWVSNLEQQKEEFLSRGGRVEEIPIGMSSYEFNILSAKERAAFCTHSSPSNKVRVQTGEVGGDDFE
jgi:hypothetical protein